jgi:hypothetical protein
MEKAPDDADAAFLQPRTGQRCPRDGAGPLHRWLIIGWSIEQLYGNSRFSQRSNCQRAAGEGVSARTGQNQTARLARRRQPIVSAPALAEQQPEIRILSITRTIFAAAPSDTGS